MYGRRTVLMAGFATAGAALDANANACTILPRLKNYKFSDEACRRKIDQFVDLLNRAPAMTANAIESMCSEQGIKVSNDLFWSEDMKRTDLTTFLQTYSFSGGQRDRKPVRLLDPTLIRQRGDYSSYAFTLRRHRYREADPEDCNGLFAHDAFWGDEDVGYIALLHYDREIAVRAFPEWLAEHG